MSLKDKEDVYLYVSSIANHRTFPENTASNFENRILPIILDPNREYEVGLSNILFPKFFYCLRENDPDCGIQFHARIKQSDFDDYEYNFYNYLPERNIVSNFKSAYNIMSIIASVNHQMMKELRRIVDETYLQYFPYSEIIYYDPRLERAVINSLIVGPEEERLYSDIFLQFSPHMALVLGFDSGYRYSVFHQGKGEESSSPPPSTVPLDSDAAFDPPPARKIIAPHSVRADSGHDYLYVYSDIISPTRFGNQIVNILDAIPLPHDATSKGVNPIMYKPVNVSTIQSVAIKITNQNGNPIYFEDGHSVTCVLHIRPR